MNDPVSLRYRIRAETRAAHTALDTLVARLDLSTRPGFGDFVAAHCDALAVLTAYNTTANADLAGRLAAARQDLTALGRPWPPTVPSAGPPGLEPDGLSYVVLGAHLGARLLRRQWQAATDPKIRAAGALMREGDQASRWAQLCARLSAMPATGRRADRIVASAEHAFAVFYRAFTRSTVVAGAAE